MSKKNQSAHAIQKVLSMSAGFNQCSPRNLVSPSSCFSLPQQVVEMRPRISVKALRGLSHNPRSKAQALLRSSRKKAQGLSRNPRRKELWLHPRMRSQGLPRLYLIFELMYVSFKAILCRTTCGGRPCG